MAQVVRQINADVVKRGSTRTVYAKQHDRNSRFLNVQIQEEGTNIVVAPASTVTMNVERPDKLTNIFYGTVNEDGSVKVPLTSWMLDLEGTLVCDVSIIDEDPEVAKLTTMQFNIYVEAAVVGDDAIIETEEYSVIVDLLARTDEAAKIAAGAAENAQLLKDTCEQATQECQQATQELNKTYEEMIEGGYVRAMQEYNSGMPFRIWLGTEAEYALVKDMLPVNTFCITTDGPKRSDFVRSGYGNFGECVPRLANIIDSDLGITYTDDTNNIFSTEGDLHKALSNLFGKMQFSETRKFSFRITQVLDQDVQNWAWLCEMFRSSENYGFITASSGWGGRVTRIAKVLSNGTWQNFEWEYPYSYPTNE